MSLVLSTAGPLKPEIRLAQAVSQFEASLSGSQKVAFRNQRKQSLKSPPSTKDVMRITAEIDISQKAGGRCFGPRFTKFLHGVQQFAALGDVVICLRYHQYAQKSALGRFTSSLNDADIKEARSTLLFWSKSIQVETTTLIARTIETEAKSNSRFRAMMNLSSKSASQQQKQTIVQNTLDRCSNHDYETTWRQIRKAGNTSLYTQMPEYVRWATGSNPKVLVLFGKLGYGKSVTLANIVDDLNLRIDPEVSGLAYFFCRHDVPESLLARTVVGSLVRQIISHFPRRLVDMEVFDTDYFLQLSNLVRRVVPPDYAVYVVLDGLDLCSLSEQKKITHHLDIIRKCCNIHICISLRMEPAPELQSFITEISGAEVVRLPDNTSDIEAFVSAQLEIALSENSLIMGDPSIILEIQNALVQGSEHMFLWVALQIKSLCAMQTDHDIREALAHLPRDLSQIYSRILQRSDRPDQPLQPQILKLILSARRPLSADEMREALSVTPGDTTWNSAKRLNSIYPALAACGCLITVDEEELTIRTIHPSVNQFLLQGSPAYVESTHGFACRFSFTERDAHELIASIVLTYLSYDIFQTEVASRVPALNIGSTPSHVIRSTIGTSRSVQDIALKLLRSRKQSTFDASNAFAEHTKHNSSPKIDDFHFLHYAKAHVLHHLSDLPTISCVVSESLIRLLRRDEMLFKDREEALGLLWLMVQSTGKSDFSDLLHNLYVEGEPVFLFSHTDTLPALFRWAIETDRLDAIQYLLDMYRPLFVNYNAVIHGGNMDLVSPSLRKLCESHRWALAPTPTELSHFLFGRTPFLYAIEKGQNLIVELFVADEIIDITETIGDGPWDSAVGVAVKHGNTEILRLLLSRDMWDRLRPVSFEGEALWDEVHKLGNSVDVSFVKLLRDYLTKASLEALLDSAMGRRSPHAVVERS
ncbi:unnamed protein product [Alternaria alternata]